MLDERNEIDDEIELTGEDNIDDIEIEEAEEKQSDSLKKLKEKLKQCESEKMKILEDSQRAAADFLNTKKRLTEQQNLIIDRTTDDYIEKLLPICDSFQMAMSNKELWESIDQTWRAGMEGIYKQMQSLLDEYDVVRANPLDEAFDPTKHEALGTEESDSESDTVIKVIQDGYFRKGNLIRPAKVILSK